MMTVLGRTVTVSLVSEGVTAWSMVLVLVVSGGTSDIGDKTTGFAVSAIAKEVVDRA